MSQVFTKLKDESQRHTALDVPIETIRLNEHGELMIRGVPYSRTEKADKWLASKCRIPNEVFWEYSTPLQNAIVNETLAKFCKKYSGLDSAKVTFRGNQVIGFGRPRLLEIEPHRILEICHEATPSDLRKDELLVKEFSHLEERGLFRITLISNQAGQEVQKGDLVYAGLNIYFENGGKFSLQIGTALYRLACSNGMVVPICQKQKHLTFERIKRGRKEDAAFLERKIKAAAEESWKDWQKKLEALAAYREEKVEPRKIIEAIAKERRYSQSLVERLMEALSQDELDPLTGDRGTMLHVLNALSRLGTHGNIQQSRYAQELRRLAGRLSIERIHRCDACGRILNSLN